MKQNIFGETATVGGLATSAAGPAVEIPAQYDPRSVAPAESTPGADDSINDTLIVEPIDADRFPWIAATSEANALRKAARDERPQRAVKIDAETVRQLVNIGLDNMIEYDLPPDIHLVWGEPVHDEARAQLMLLAQPMAGRQAVTAFAEV